jgi:F420-dependent oxidoreductase-like protein
LILAGESGEVASLLEQARRAELQGFATGWLTNTYQLDAIVAAALCGRATQEIELGTAVVAIQPRHPVAMAQTALSAQAAASGRFTLGIGLSHRRVVESQGLSFAHPYRQMVEYLEALLPLYRQGEVAYRGEIYNVTARLAVPGARGGPVLLAALGPRMLALAGAVADGTITWMTGPKTIAGHIAPRLNEAAAAAGRPAPRVVAGVPIAVTGDHSAARDQAARSFAVYNSLPSYRAMLDREGAADPSEAAIIGDEDAVRAQVDRYHEAGVTDFWAVPFRVRGDDEAVPRTRGLLVKLAHGR